MKKAIAYIAKRGHFPAFEIPVKYIQVIKGNEICVGDSLHSLCILGKNDVLIIELETK